MEHQPLILEKRLAANTAKVWEAISTKEAIRKWSFDVDDFRPEIGFEFRFNGGDDCVTYLHICVVMEVIPLRKLAYSWRYDGLPGTSVVTMELFEEGNETVLRLTHEGLESMSGNGPAFARANFEAGWNDIVGNLLKNYLEVGTV